MGSKLPRWLRDRHVAPLAPTGAHRPSRRSHNAALHDDHPGPGPHLRGRSPRCLRTRHRPDPRPHRRRARVALHRPRHRGRAHQRPGGRAGHPVAHLRRGRVGRRVEERQPRHHLDAPLRRAGRTSPSATSRWHRPIRWRFGSARARPTTGTVRRGGRASTIRRTEARRGGSRASRTRGTSAASWCIPRIRTASGWPRWAISSARTRSAASFARPTGAPHGRSSST